MFRHNRNETRKCKNTRRTKNEPICEPACERSPFVTERSNYLIEPIEEAGSNESLDNPVERNLRRNPNEEQQLLPRFTQRGPVYQPEFRATQITRIQTRIMDDEDEEECLCLNKNGNKGLLLSAPNMNMLKATPGMDAQMLQFTKDSMLLKHNLGCNRTSMLPQFTEDNVFTATSAPFKPKRESLSKSFSDDDTAANTGYMAEFGNLVANQLERLETQFIIYKIKLEGTKSLKTFLLKHKYVLLSIPLVLFLLWLMLLLGVLIGSVYCSGMEDCPWSQGTTMAPRFLYTPHSVF